MKVLLIRLSSAGDILAAHKTVKALKDAGCEVHMAVKGQFADLTGQLGADRVFGLQKGGLGALIKELNEIKYGAVIDIQNNPKSRAISSALKADIKKTYSKDIIARRFFVLFKLYFGKNIPVARRYLNALKGVIPDKYLTGADAAPRMKKKEKIKVLIHTGARWPLKRWPYYGELVRLLAADKKISLITVTGVKDEVAKNDPILYIKGRKIKNLIGKTSLVQMVRETGKADLFIGNDTVAAHAAAMNGIPAFIFLGPTAGEFGFITKPVFLIFQRSLACRPCSLHGGNKCPAGTFECMKKITAKEAAAKISAYIRGKNGGI